MKSYKDYLRERKVPPGPWVTDEHGTPINEKKTAKILKLVKK